MHVAHISFHADTEGRTPEQLLRAWPTLVDVAEAASGAGVRVSVIQACARTQHLTRNGVAYHFLPFGRALPAGDGSHDLGGLIRKLAVDVLHVQGLQFALDVLALSAAAPGIPIMLQDHACRPPRPWRRRLWRREFSAVSALSFCSREQALPFTAMGLVPPETVIFEIPESSSRFTPGDQQQARLATDSAGSPLVLWVGHLDANKDPLAVLEGISRAAHVLPQLRLYCCFGTAPLLRQVQRRIAADPLLRGRVHLLGRVPHEQIEQLMRAADLFVLGSHREGSGYSLIEALACGLPPVVTDIPSFRALTGEGRIGALWPAGNARRLCEQLLSLAARPRAASRAQTRAQFEGDLSFHAVGRKLASAYQCLLERRGP